MDTLQEAAVNGSPVLAPVRLAASRELSTKKGVFPQIPDISPAAPRFEPISLSETAQLYSFTIIHPNPKTGQMPFALIYADFPEDVRVFGRLELSADERPVIGMPVRSVSRDDGSAYFFVKA